LSEGALHPTAPLASGNAYDQEKIRTHNNIYYGKIQHMLNTKIFQIYYTNIMNFVGITIIQQICT